MYLKIMSAENAPDGDSRKTFRIIADVLSVEFTRELSAKEAAKPENRLISNRSPKATAMFRAGPAETFWPEGNCYLMNEAGDTIASFGVAPYHA
jgi:hypothetical protein